MIGVAPTYSLPAVRRNRPPLRGAPTQNAPFTARVKTSSQPPSRPARLAHGATILPLLLVGACVSPDEYLEQADAEVYSLIDARRSALFDEAGGFRLEPPTDSLRQSILRGEWESDVPISLIHAIDIAAENNRDFQARKEGLYVSALDVTLERWRLSNQPAASFNAAASGVGDESAEVDVGGRASLSRLLGSGASIVTDIGAGLFRVVSTGDGWDAFSNIGFSITQPLLRGGGKRITLEPLTQAERDLVYEVRDFERFRRTFVVDVADEVYDLLQRIDELENEERTYDNLVALRERNQALALAGRMSDIEADQARQDELQSENRLLALRAGLERRRDDFNLFLGLPIETRIALDPAEFERLSGEDPLLELIDADSAAELALAQRLDHLTSRDVLEDAQRSVEIARDALRAGLDLSVSVRSDAPEGRPASFRLDDTSWSAGLGLDLPIDRIPERNSYRRSLITLEATRRDVEREADQIRVNVRDAVRRTLNARASYELQTGAVALAERRVESANLNLEAGRASTRDVLDAQDDLLQARNAATSELVNFTLTRLDLYLELEALRVGDEGWTIDPTLVNGLLEGEQ